MKLGVMACCAVMLVPLGAFLLAGVTLGGHASNLGLPAALALGLGAHVVMHRTMGRPSHDSTTGTRQKDPEQDRDPAAAVVTVDAAH